MHEQDFKQALRDSMAIVTAPPMNENVVLDAAKRAVRRRRARWASGASALAVVALATGVALAAPGADRSGSRVGAKVTETNPPSDTEPDWPDGQTDATASSGPHYEQGVNLVDKLLEVVPQGYDSPPDLNSNGIPLRFHQARSSDTGSWGYDASIPLVKAGEGGALDASVTTSTEATNGDQAPCAIFTTIGTDPSGGVSCTEVNVAGKRVGVATRPGMMSSNYRYPDNTLVVISQHAVRGTYGYPALTELPFTDEQLAELAVDPRFHLD